MKQESVIPIITEEDAQAAQKAEKFNENVKKQLERVNRKWFLIALGFAILIYFLLKSLYHSKLVPCFIGIESVCHGINEMLEHMDLLGYFIGVGAIFVGGWIAKVVDSKTEEKLSELNSATGNIKTATESFESSTKEKLDELAIANNALQSATNDIIAKTQKLVDASSIIVIEKFSDIFDNLINLLEEAYKGDTKKLYFRNGPSSFGKIHSYNKRLIKNFKDETGISDSNMLAFHSKVEKIKDLLSNCAGKIDDFKMLVSNDNDLDVFINKYIETENTPSDIFNGDGLIYYKAANTISNKREIVLKSGDLTLQGEITLEENDKKIKQEIENDIKESFKMFNNSVINLCRTNRENKGNKGNIGDVITEVLETNMQIYLVESGGFQKSLIIFYYTDSEGQPDTKRQLVGIYSTHPYIYKALEKIFVKEFYNIKNRQETEEKKREADERLN